MLDVHQGRPEEKRSEIEDKSYDLLDRLGIAYERCDHPPVMTNDSCQAPEEALGIELCKNLFLRNKRKTQYYLLVMPGYKRLDTKSLQKQIGESRLSFGNAQDMMEMLGITPGSVSVLALMNDPEGKIRVLIDEDTFHAPFLGFHPCLNTSSLKAKAEDIWEKVLPATNHDYTLVSLNEPEA